MRRFWRGVEQMSGGALCIHHGLAVVGRRPIGPVHTGARHFADGVQAWKWAIRRIHGLPVHVDRNTADGVMGGWTNRERVDAKAKAKVRQHVLNRWETIGEHVRIEVFGDQPHRITTRALEVRVNRTRHHVTGAHVTLR